MAVHLYSAESAWVVVPDCMEPPLAAHALGPLTICGRLQDVDFLAHELIFVQAEFDRKSYAALPLDVGFRLMGAVAAPEQHTEAG